MISHSASSRTLDIARYPDHVPNKASFETWKLRYNYSCPQYLVGDRAGVGEGGGEGRGEGRGEGGGEGGILLSLYHLWAWVGRVLFELGSERL